MAICVYCGYEKPDDEMTQEHVIPRAIGGNIFPTNPFLLNNVCAKCNSLCGSYIDGPFIRNWFTQNSRADIAIKYVDLSTNPILPLHYIGVINGLQYSGKICELWLGPTGDTIYHFHNPYPQEPNTPLMIGTPLYIRGDEIDNGFAFLFVRSNNPEWHPTILHSFIEQFKKSILYLGNGPTPPGGRFSNIPAELENIHTTIQGMIGQTHQARFEMNVHYGDRFLVKVALGIGCLLLNNSFATSMSAQLLRNALWTKNHEERSRIPIHGSGFPLGYFGDIQHILNWPGGHFIGLINNRDSLNLSLSFYETQCAIIKISSEPSHWAGKIDNEGLTYVIAPGLQKHVGPINLASFIAHKITDLDTNHELSLLEMEMQSHSNADLLDIPVRRSRSSGEW